MNGRDLTLGLVGALAMGAALGRRGSRASAETLYHGSTEEVRVPRAGTFLTPDPQTASTYARYGPNQSKRIPQDGVVSSYSLDPKASVQTFRSFADAYAHYGVRSSQALARTAVQRREADVVAVYDERILVHPSVVNWIGSEPVAGEGSRATDLTSTPAFRRWFGESKVVDAEGRPLVVYHGTTAGGFDAFRPNYRKGEQLGFGIHFAHDRSVAELYADPGRAGRKEGSAPKVYEVYLSIRNPIDFTQRTFIEGTPEFGVMNDLLQQVFEGDTDHLYEQDGNGVRLLDTAYRNYLDALPGPMVERTLRDVGFDGVIYNALILGERRRRAIAYIAFRPEQIKSATGNRGTFDPADPRISFNRGVR
jgi:hypothetical protein